MKDRYLALAGAFQASELVRQAACHGTWSGYAATACLNSLFRLEADSTAAIYGGSEHMKLGVETMLAVLEGEERHVDALRYVIGLLQVERKFRRAGKLQHQVGQRLDEISSLGSELEQHERQDLQAREISELYSGTISHLSPRIVVNGKPQYLKNQRTVEWIRTLLLAGLRSATLWQQLGGGRFELMFGRKNIIREARAFLMG
ncbi:MAG TPA: high frequency lysogenization protein HflD [Xanthomonadales bacterium]|nr:high frequency lysogenization protein HflD [Xanthomonadales bacterium]